MRVCRVVPDLPAVDRVFDYLVPEEHAGDVRVGTIVRVPLHGRRVRGWVVDDGVEPATAVERLRPLAGVVSLGPPPAVVALSEWAAWRWAGPRTAFLRAGSPPNTVRGLPPRAAKTVPPAAGVIDAEAEALAKEALSASPSVIRWPPARDPFDVVLPLVAASGSTIVVAPNGATAIHLARRLARSGRNAALLRPDDTGAVRTRAWVQMAAGDCIVIGGRVAALAPVPDLAAAVILDDADEALQEERAPTWHGRDLVFERALRAGCSAVVVSPAPTVDALVAARHCLEPSRAMERAGWPIVDVVDRRTEAPGLGLFSERLVTALRDTVVVGERAVCVLNRKGRARLLACDACGELVRCERCGAAASEGSDGLVCARCDAVRPRLCAHCGGTRLRVLRAGVARVRDDLAALLIGVDVAEVDAATEDLPDVPVLVGTEAVLHRASPARLVAFLDFDQELLAPRLRAAEQALWLLVRAARLVGSRASGGRVLVQTRLARHEVLDAAIRANPSLVAATERERREALSFPPYGGLAAISGDASAVTAVRENLAPILGIATGGDDRHLLVRAPDPRVLSDALAVAVPPVRTTGARLRVEVEPLRL
jgi:primosomal protein N' (replication factor Y)